MNQACLQNDIVKNIHQNYMILFLWYFAWPQRASFSGDGAHKFAPWRLKKMQKRSRDIMQFPGLSNLHSTRLAITAMAGSPTTSPPPSVSDYILDSFSGFLLGKGKKLMDPYWPTDRDPLDWLPPKLHEQLHKSEAFVSRHLSPVPTMLLLNTLFWACAYELMS